ncbi:MAG TPA: RHS repeat-associated core domain-containing protein [Saprospiraceae bacterium]|nr:RHS repeat-associated core domain-containing protein [Saprospiraceae bacterium]
MSRLITAFLLFLSFNMFCSAQTDYSSDPPQDVFTVCPLADMGVCAGYHILGDEVLKLKLDNITSTHFVFQIRKCSGTFSTSGTAWIKKTGVCGTVVGGPVDYSVGASTISISVPIPSNFYNGVIDYYALIHVDNGNNEGYYAGPVEIIASTPDPFLEFATCINSPSHVTMNEELEVPFSVNAVNQQWYGTVFVFMTEQGNPGNTLEIGNPFLLIDPDDGPEVVSVNETVDVVPGVYRIYVYGNASNNDYDDWVHANDCTPTQSVDGTITHYKTITVDPPCSDGATINITNPDPGTFYTGGLLNIQWTGSLQGTECPVRVYYTVNGGQEITISNSTSDDGSLIWSLNNFTLNSSSVEVFVAYTIPDADGNIVEDGSGLFSIYTDLVPPTLVSPQNGESLNSGTSSVSFAWDKNNPDGLATYEIRLRDTTTDEILLDYMDVGDVDEYTYTSDEDLVDEHIYRWVVRANNVGGTAESGVNLFEIGAFGLEMSAPLSFGEDMLYEGETYAFTTTVDNLGNQDWDGSLYLIVNDASPAEDLGSFLIEAGSEVDIAYQFQPDEDHVGEEVSVELRYQSNGLGPSYLVPINPFGSFTNPTTIDIIENSLTLTYPNGPVSFEGGDEITDFTWTSSGNIQNVSLELVTASEQVIDVIVANIVNDGHYNGPYTIPEDIIPGDYKIKIYRHPNGPEEDFSDAYLHISNPESFILELASGINIDPNSPAMGMPAEFEATVVNNGFADFYGTVEMVLQTQLGADIAVLDAEPDILLAEDGLVVLSHSTDSIISDQGIYRILIRFIVDGESVWYEVNDGEFLNPLNFNILGEGGQCDITNPPPSNTESYQAVQYFCQNGVIQQPAEGDVHPSDPIIKEDLAMVVFLCLYGFDPNAPTPADNFPVPFGDMQDQENQAYARYGKVLSYLEYGDGISPFYRRFFNYNPGSTVTRGQVCKVIVEAFDFNKDAFFVPFADVPGTHPEFLHIAKCAELGIVNGHTGNFNPDQNATREQVFIMLHRLMTQCEECNIPEPDAEDFFNPGNYTPANLGRYLSVSDANFDQYSKTSFVIPGRNLPLVFAHNYNSFLTELPEELFCVWYNDQWISFRPLGPGWSHSYNSYIVKIDGWTHPNGTTQPDRIAIFWPGGAIHVYEQDGNNLTAVTQGLYDDIVYDAEEDTYVITKKNQIKYTFEQRNSANPDWPYVMTKIEDRNYNKIQLSYEDYAGGGIRLKEVLGTNAKKLNFSYYQNTCRIYEVKDPLNRKVQFAHGGPSGQDLMSYKFFEGATPLSTTYNYFNHDTGKHLLKIITLPNGNFVNNTYYQRKLQASTTNGPNGALSSQQVNWELDGVPSGETSSSVSIFDGSKTYTYDYESNGLGKTTHMSTPTNVLEQAQYNDLQNPTLPTAVTIDGITTQYEYDENGNVTRIIQPLGVEHEFTYTALNDIETYVNPRNLLTTFDYDEGNLTSVNAPIGSTTMSYNVYGQVKTVTNPEGITVTYEYDALGFVKSVNSPLGISSHATYDPVGRLKTSEDPNGHISSYTYHDRDFIKTITDPMSYVTQFAYDNNGNLTDVINAKGKVTHMEYDYFDWLKSVEFEGDKKSYFYDLEGKLMKIKKPDGEFLQYTYHADGNLKANGYASFTYDTQNRLKTVAKNGKVLTYGYDNLHRITSTDYDGAIVQYEYDHNSNVTKVIYPGTGKDVDYSYDANDRLKTVEDWNGNETEYFYLDDGRIDHITYPNGVLTEYFYDSAGRMDSSVTRHGSEIITAYGYVLAPNGNHLVERKTEPFPEPELPASNTTSTYNDDNTITTNGSNNYSFDDNGNLISGAGRTYSWDSHDMLIGIEGDVNATYTYDGLGHRRSSIINGVGKKYVLDILGMSQILIETNLNNDPENYYVYGLGLISRIKPDNSTRYYHGDFRGSTIAMTDEDGTFTHKYQYDVFGNLIVKQENDINSFQFLGLHGILLELEGAYFLRARFYNSNLGRFINEDPIWSTNLYTYCSNSPNVNIDPSGLNSYGILFDLVESYIETGYLISKGDYKDAAVEQIVLPASILFSMAAATTSYASLSLIAGFGLFGTPEFMQDIVSNTIGTDVDLGPGLFIEMSQTNPIKTFDILFTEYGNLNQKAANSIMNGGDKLAFSLALGFENTARNTAVEILEMRKNSKTGGKALIAERRGRLR